MNYAIAGGSKGIGQEVVRLLAPQATQLHIYSRTAPEVLPENAVHHPHDFLTDQPLAELPEALHGAVYCPGSITLRSFRSLKAEHFQSDLEINLMGAVRFLQQCYSPLKQSASADQPASAVLFSTIAVQQGMPMHASIASAKGAVEGLARSLAAEWAPDIRVNAIAPALTDTPLASRMFSTPEKRAAMDAKYPLGRTGRPGDLAAAVTYLLGGDSGWVTGQVLHVDGGLSTLRR